MAEMNFGLLGPALTADYAGRVQQGFEAGRSLADQQAMRNALSAYAANPNDARAVQFIMSRNPELGAKLQDRAREGHARSAMGVLALADLPGGPNALLPQPTTPAEISPKNAVNALMPMAVDPLAPLPDPAARQSAPPSPPVPQQDSRQAASPAVENAWRTLAQSDPETFMKLRKMRTDERAAAAKTLGQQLDVAGRVMSAVLAAPPEQQDALYQQFRHELGGAGVIDLPDQWDPQSAEARMRMGMTVLQALSSDRQERNTESQIEYRDQRLDEYGRHNRAMESYVRRGQDLRAQARDAKPPTPKAPTPTTVVGRIMDKQARGEPLSAAERQTLDEYRAGKGHKSSGGSDLIGTVYQRGGTRIQYSKKAGGYVDLATGQRVE